MLQQGSNIILLNKTGQQMMLCYKKEDASNIYDKLFMQVTSASSCAAATHLSAASLVLNWANAQPGKNIKPKCVIQPVF